MHKKQALRIVLSLLGVLMIGVSISFSRLANLGTDPFTTLNLGLSNFFDISYGTNSVFTNTIGGLTHYSLITILTRDMASCLESWPEARIV